MQIKINIPNGYKIKAFDEKTGEVNFEPIPKDIKERINGLEDIFILNNTTQEEFDAKWQGFPPHKKAQDFEELIVAAYNEGKFPDFTDGTYKFSPCFNHGSPSGSGFSYHDFGYGFTVSRVGARLVFHGKDAKANMLDAVNKFLPQYKDSRTL